MLPSRLQVALLFSLVAQSCGQSTEARANTLVVSGRLDDVLAARILASRLDQIDTVVVTSQGGEIASAIKIGRAIRDSSAKLIVRGYCLSACAHFIFAPARSKFVEDGSVVAFHGTATARMELLNISQRPDLANDYQSISALEKDFYREAGLDPSLLTEPLGMVRPSCYAINPKGEFGAGNLIAIMTRGSFLIPSRDYLNRVNVTNFGGFWISDQAEVFSALVGNPPLQKLSFRLMDGTNIPDKLEAVGECDEATSKQLNSEWEFRRSMPSR